MSEEKLVPKLRFSGFDDEWKTYKLKDLLHNKSSSISINQLDDNVGNYPLYGASGFLKCIDFYEMDSDYISIVKDGSGVGNISFHEKNTSVVNTSQYILPKENLNIHFIFYLLQTINLNKYKTGSTIPHIYFKDYSIEKVKIPKYDEQKKIGILLKNLDAKIEILDNKLQMCQNFKKYLMQQIFTQKLRFADDENWVTVTIANIFDNITDYVAAGSFADIRKNVTYLKDPDYAQLIRTADLKSNFTNGDFVYVDKHAFEYLWRVNLDEPCIVLPNIGNIGEVYYINPKELPYSNNALAPNAILLKSNDNIKFKYYLLESPYFKNQLDIINEAGGRGKFNKTNLKKIKIKVPNNDLEKEKIAKCLSNVDNKLKLFNIQLIEMQEFKKGLLQQMFVVQLILSLLQNKKHI